MALDYNSMCKYFFIFLIFLGVFGAFSLVPDRNVDPAFTSKESKQWVDSVYKSLSTDQKIGQLFMVPAYAGGADYNKSAVDSLINNFYIGGLTYFLSGPERQVDLTNHFQAISKVPLLIAIDGEWGLNMRIDSTTRFPRQMTLGANPNEQLIYDMGVEIARQLKILGIHMNYAPCVDINNNPMNPIINSRSFGENKEDVTRKASLYMKAMQDNSILACAKHFPGHGNTETDSHSALPVINQSAEAMDTMELFPYKQLIKQGLGSVMIAHLNIPSLDSATNAPSSLSYKIVTKILKDKLKFKGLIITDALNMKGVTANVPPGEIEVNALKAGNDMLLMAENVPLAVSKIKEAFANKTLDSNDVFKSVKKILEIKYWCGLNDWKPLSKFMLNERLNNAPETRKLTNSLFEKSVTILKNNNNTIPLSVDGHHKIASLVVNDTLDNYFQQSLDLYTHSENFALNKELSATAFDTLMNQLAQFETVIVSFHNTSIRSYINFNITPQMAQTITSLQGRTKLVTVVFGNLYTLNILKDADKSQALILSYEDTYLPAMFTAQILFGARNAFGKLPARPSSSYTLYEGLTGSTMSNVLRFEMPSRLSIDEKIFSRIDTIIKKNIDDKVFPGCQMLVAYKGNIILNKGYGKFTYDNNSTAVNEQSLYDIASITKMAATSLAVMKLYDEGKIDLKQRMSFYVPELRRSDKKNLLVEDILTHQSGLKGWIPFYQSTLDDKGNYKKGIYAATPVMPYSNKICDSLYMNVNYMKTIWKEILRSPLTERGKYIYSDLGMIITQKMVENITQQSLEEYVDENFYYPLGLNRIAYNPLQHFTINNIVPTENDTAFRKRLVRGYVHDPAAAMFGGVSGHAGVFSNAHNLGIIMQMLLQGGAYSGRQYITTATVEKFTKQYWPNTNNRRGLFFDKPEANSKEPVCSSASLNTFGHTGFTGTCAWADPNSELVFIFLSNRVYPSAANNRLVKYNTRSVLMQVVYDALPKQSGSR